MNKTNKIKRVLAIAMSFTFFFMYMSSSCNAYERHYVDYDRESDEQMTILHENSSAFVKRLKSCAASAGGGALVGAAAGCAWGGTGGTVVLPGIGTIAGCLGGALLGGTAGGLGAGAIGCGYSVYDTWNWDKLSNMREFIKIRTEVCYHVDGEINKSGHKKVSCHVAGQVSTRDSFPIKKKLIADIYMTPAFMGESNEENKGLYEEEIGGIKLKNILIPVKITIDKTVKIKVTKTDGSIVDESIKHIPPDVNGKEHFLFYIKNNPIDFEKQMIRFEFTPLADNMGESKAKLHIYYGTLDKPIVDNSDYDRWLIFTDKQ